MSEDPKNQLTTTKLHEMYSLPTDTAEEAQTFSQLAKANSWLPRLQLCTATSDMCKKKKVKVDNYALISGQDDVIELGESTEVIVFSWRPCALDLRGDKPQSYYDPKDAKFQEVEKMSKVKDSKCVVGPELLVFVPKVQKFATFHFNSKTMQRMVDQMFDTTFVDGKPVRKYPSARLLRSKLIETTEYSWQAPVISELVTPITAMPHPDVVSEQVAKFKNPPKQVTGEKVEEPAEQSGRVR